MLNHNLNLFIGDFLKQINLKIIKGFNLKEFLKAIHSILSHSYIIKDLYEQF